MTTTISAPRPVRRPVTLPTDIRVTQWRVIRSEWVKFWSLTSSRIAVAAAFVGMVGIGILYSSVTASNLAQLPPAERTGFDAASASLAGYLIAQLIVGVLGVLFVTGEYGTGMVRASMSCAPKRLPVLWAKAAVFAVITFVLCTIASFTSFFIGQAIFSTHDLQTTLSAPGVLRAVIGMGIYLTGVGLLGVALGWIIRNTAGTIATVFGILLVLPTIVAALPQSWSQHISPYLPSTAGHALAVPLAESGSLAPWTGFGVFAAYLVVATIIAAALLKRRDA